MQKIFNTLLFLCVMTLGAIGGTLTLSSPEANVQAGYSAFDFVLSNNYLTPSDGQKPISAKTVNLTSITITPAQTWYTNSAQGVGMAIYKQTGENVWTYVGRSDWQRDYPINGTATLTFNFDKLELSTSDKYTVVFYGKKVAFNALSSESTLSSLVGLQAPTDKKPIAVMGLKSVNGATDDFTMFGRKKEEAIALRSQSPCVTFTATTPTITPYVLGGLAAIALLALCGLAVRRRCK